MAYRRRFTSILVLVFAIGMAIEIGAEVRLPALFSDHLVVQRDRPIHVWGWGEPGERVRVTIDDRSASTRASKDGIWDVSLKAMHAGGPHTLVVEGDNRLQFDDVLVGDVWVCSGQSNMQWPVQLVKDADLEIPFAYNPNIRLFSVPLEAADKPQGDVDSDGWKHASPESAAGFSAVGFYFGREVYARNGVPLGLINSSYGGTRVEAWISAERLKKHEDYRALWESGSGHQDAGVEREQDFPTVLYNAMIAPLVKFPITGAIWYQGESNAGRAYQYRSLFPLLIEDWRKLWDQGAFPFLYVQLANFRAREAEPGASTWAELREAQTMALELPKTAMAVIIDIGEAEDIHPKNKQDVGKRLALAAEKVAYGEDVTYSGPLYRSHSVESGRMRIQFDHVDGGLSVDGEYLTGFSIAGADQKFYWAHAAVDGDEVVVSHPEVARPAAVRYGWADNPDCNLYNGAGLPASPFRTDDWPGVTVGNK